MTNIDALYKELAKDILKREGKLDDDAKATVAKLVAYLKAKGWQITPESEQQLSDYLSGMQDAIAASINQAAIISAGASGLSTLKQSALIANLTEQSFNRQWPDGLKLSDRVWNWNQSVRTGLTDVLRQSIKQGESVDKTLYAMQRTIERNHGAKRFKIVENYQDDWVKDLFESAIGVIHDPETKAIWKAAVHDAEQLIAELKVTGTRVAGEQVLKKIKAAVEIGREKLAENAVKWWLYDKQLYALKRIIRTEMATALHNAVIDSTIDDVTIIGYQWTLSGSHPVYDICDVYANVDMGLGKGVFTKEHVPRHKAHPHCMCLIRPRVTTIRQKGTVSYDELLAKLPKPKKQI